MSMRVDDINQKENTIKMSLQTVDFRLGRLEEIALQTQESLYHIQMCLSSGHVSLGHYNLADLQASHDSYDSMIISEATQNMSDPLQSQSIENISDSAILLQSMPSPVLVHSKRPVEQEQIEKFTNYSRGRQLSGNSFSTEPQAEEAQPGTSGSKPAAPVRTLTVEKKTPLLLRRQGPLLSSIKIRRAGSADVSRLKTPSFVRFADSLLSSVTSATESHDTNAIFTNVKLPSETSTSTAGVKKPASLDLTSQQQQKHTDIGEIRSVNTPLSPEVLPLSPSQSIPNVSSFSTSPVSEGIPQSAVKDLSAILVPFHAEYTTITDEIDTSCVADHSPTRSPVSANIFFSESFHKRSGQLDTPAYHSEKQMLKQAEEVEHRKMERVIRHRLRQISLDDGENVADIAMVVAAELALSKQLGHDEDGDASELEEDETTPLFPQITISNSSPPHHHEHDHHEHDDHDDVKV